jgi:hypothetical protein
VPFDVTVVDVCLTTTITPFALTDMTFAVGDFSIYGTITDQNFNEPTDSAAVAVGDPTICRAKTYEVVYAADGAAQSLVTINTITADDEFQLVADTDSELDEGTHSLKLIVHLNDPTYPTLEVTFDVIVNPPACDCTLLTWDYPVA